MVASQVALVTGGGQNTLELCRIDELNICCGAASGLGLAVVESLVNHGWDVAIVDKDRAAGEQGGEETW